MKQSNTIKESFSAKLLKKCAEEDLKVIIPQANTIIVLSKYY